MGYIDYHGLSQLFVEAIGHLIESRGHMAGLVIGRDLHTSGIIPGGDFLVIPVI